MKTKLAIISMAFVFTTAHAQLAFTNKLLQVNPLLGRPSLLSQFRLQPLSSPPNAGLPPAYLQFAKKFHTGAFRSKFASAPAPRVLASLTAGAGTTTIADNTTSGAQSQNGGFICYDRNVDVDVNFYEVPVYSVIEQLTELFPGQLLSANDFIHNNFKPYPIPLSYRRNPYDINVSLKPTDPATPVSGTIGGDGKYSQGSVEGRINQLVASGAAGQDLIQAVVAYSEVRTKEETAARLGFNFNVNVAPELGAILTGIPVGFNASLDASTIATNTTSNSRILMTINYGYYFVGVTPPTNNQFPTFLSPLAGPDLDPNLAVVSSVLYGGNAYVLFESTQSTSDLQETLNTAFGLAGPKGTGSASFSLSDATRKQFQSSHINITASARGVPPPPNNGVITSIDSLMTWLASIPPYSYPNNAGRPIAFTMNLINNGDALAVDLDTKFVNRVCGAASITNLLFDVDLELQNFELKKTCFSNTGEKLSWNLGYKAFRAGSKGQSLPSIYSYSQRSSDEANRQLPIKAGTTISTPHRENLARNLSFNELINLSVTLAGSFDNRNIQEAGSTCKRDAYYLARIDPGTGARAVAATPTDTDYRISVQDWPDMQASIAQLANSGEFQKIPAGDGNFMFVDFWEHQDQNIGLARVNWLLLVKPHAP